MKYRLQRFKYRWVRFTSVFRLLNRKAELKRLKKWARRKKYFGPLRLYQTRTKRPATSTST